MSTKKRLQFDFTSESYAELEQLVADTGSRTKADTVRKALRLLRFVTDAGGQVAIVDGDNVPQRIVVL